MDDAAAMRFGESIAKLARDFKRLGLRQPAASSEMHRERFALEKLHGQEVHVAVLGVSGMDFIDAANIRVANRKRALDLRR